MRRRVQALVESTGFQRLIITLIVVNAAVLGLETYPELTAEWGAVLTPLNRGILAVFVVEIVLRIYAYRGRFFRSGWGLFDLFVVAIALVPASGELAILRVLRVLRVLRMLSTVRSMRRVVGALVAAIPGIASIGALLIILYYVGVVMATNLFSGISPEHFGNLGQAATSMFRIMIGDGGLGDIVEPIGRQQPAAWLFFLVFVVIATFVVLNLFIAVTVEALERQKETDPANVPGQLGAPRPEREDQLLEAIDALRHQVASLERRLDKRGVDDRGFDERRGDERRR
ncbi:ion transporter [Phytoactinopolyspora alkaliphila]|uniref:Ion transporter n=1 Tax=Phytoactinopolyspora alkaliphila TaxID=1783498 RepID=A0A6N9YG30_9ACTN|nr:ion transporter [Phytoactinopolyspora alkaliphila]